MNGVVNFTGDLELGEGAVFWAYISPENDTAKFVTNWSVLFQKFDGAKVVWEDTITSEDPTQQLQTPELSGTFTVTVTASGPKFPEQKLAPVSWSPPDIGCNSNCASMVGIVAAPGGASANYWTTWDALCTMN